MKVFISQPMTELSSKEILDVRNSTVTLLKNLFDEDINVINSYFQNGLDQYSQLELLGKSIELMSDADLVVFVYEWEKSRGCRIEHTCAKEYGKNIMELNNE